MLRPHLGSRLVSAPQSSEKQCGCVGMPTPELSERAGGDACQQSLHSKIDPSKLAAGVVLQARRLCRLRRETALSPESAAGSSGAGIIGGVWGFGASYR